MMYIFKDGKIYMKAVEYSVAYHCNLKCSSCSHMSPFLTKNFPKIENFYNDLNVLSHVIHVNEIRLLGGEPLLNPEITEYIKIAKRANIANTVAVTTNGLLLHKMDREFWNYVDKVTVTRYPNINLNEDRMRVIRDLSKQNDVILEEYYNSYFRTSIVSKPHPKDIITKIIYLTCDNVHQNHCHMIHEGFFFKCAVPPFLNEYLSKIGTFNYNRYEDGLNLYKTNNLYYDLKEYLLKQRTLNACQYCLGYLGKRRFHYQLSPELINNPSKLNFSRRNDLDYYITIKEILKLLISKKFISLFN